jgi:hypothetical protein
VWRRAAMNLPFSAVMYKQSSPFIKNKFFGFPNGNFIHLYREPLKTLSTHLKHYVKLIHKIIQAELIHTTAGKFIPPYAEKH